MVPEHLAGFRNRAWPFSTRTGAAVKDRLTKEITYWDHRAEQLKLQEQAGKANARLNSGEARKRADGLEARLVKRMDEDRSRASNLTPATDCLGRIPRRPSWLLALMTGKAASDIVNLVDRHAGSSTPLG